MKDIENMKIDPEIYKQARRIFSNSGRNKKIFNELSIDLNLFRGLERGVFEITIPKDTSIKKYLTEFKSFINEHGYGITKTLKDIEEKRLYHLYFQKERNENA